MALLLIVVLNQQYNWAQDRIEVFLSVSLVYFLGTWISKYSLLPGKVENTKIES